MLSERVKSKKRVKNYEFSYDAILGQGAYAIVYQGRDINTNQIVAIKIINNQVIHNDYTSKQIRQEIEIMKSLNHTNIVRLIDVFHSVNNVYIVTEYCNGGDLREYLKHNILNENRAIKIFQEILVGIQELFTKGIVHRDIKPANILLHDGVFKITDFGFAKKIHVDSTMNSLVGTPLYMAPQILKRQSYTSKSDIWSLGLILYEMMFRTTPWHSSNVVELIHKLDFEQLKFPKDAIISDLNKSIIVGCLAKDELQRLSWEELFRFFQKSPKKSASSKFLGTPNLELYYMSNKPNIGKQQSQQNLLTDNSKLEYCRTMSTLSSPMRSQSAQRNISNNHNKSQQVKESQKEIQLQITDLIKKKQQLYKLLELLENQANSLGQYQFSDSLINYLQEQRSKVVCANLEQIFIKEDEKLVVNQLKCLQQHSMNFGIQIMILLLTTYRKIILQNQRTGSLSLKQHDKSTIENCKILVQNQIKYKQNDSKINQK